MSKKNILRISQTLSVKGVDFGEWYERLMTFIFVLQCLSCLAFSIQRCIFTVYICSWKCYYV